LADWKRRFDEPIKLPNGRKLVTLRDAIAWLAKQVPASEHGMKQVQVAAHCVTEAAENGGPMMFKFDPNRKSPHWGKRKLS
jgi:hypothetical protein